MPLAIVEFKELITWVNGYLAAVVQRDAPPGENDISTGWNPGTGDGQNVGGGNTPGVYDSIRDRIITRSKIEKELVGGATALNPSVYACDALHRNTSIGWFQPDASTYGTTTPGRLKAGQPNLATGTQQFYGFVNTTLEHFIYDELTGTPITTNVWPTVTDDFQTGAIASGTAGYYADATAATAGSSVVIFEGMTNTTGYSEVTRGTSFTKGLALAKVASINLIGGGAGNNTDPIWAWIDLNTNEAVGFLDIPTIADSASTDDGAEPTIDSRSIIWRRAQFVADEGSSFANPKGELHVFSLEDGVLDADFEIAGRTVAPPGVSSWTSTVTRNYVTVYDFNPFNVQTGKVRVHNRRTFLGSVDVPWEPITDGGPNSTGANDGTNERNPALYYHPPSRTYISWIGRPFVVNDDTASAPDAGYSNLIRFQRSIVVDRLSQPTPETAVTADRVVRARVVANTDLGQRATSVQVSFTLTRESTRAETFDGTATGSGTYTVEADVIDEDGSLDVREGNDVDNAGTLLVETTDYTVNYSTGVLTPVGSWPTDDIYVRYRHRGVKLTPAHGTLLGSSGLTDVSGVAYASVSYPAAAVEGELDNLSATV